ncbi:MAG: MtrB/PioB family decaheme-associated outer membrane protein [Gammaproteobacteria bacterium]|nr:MtrB/PioB family decaheme-associated outer membrane protein [Gammaproteobacteria bacterium]
MKTTKHTFVLTVIAAALLMTYSVNAAENEDEIDISSLTTPDSTVSIGLGHVSGEREQFGVFDDVRDDTTQLLLDADINQRDDDNGTWIKFKAHNLGIDNRSFEASYERQSDWGVNLGFKQTPYIAPYTVNTGLLGIGTETQTVTNLAAPGAGTDIKLAMEREQIDLGFFKYLRPDLNFKINFKNEEKDGDRHWGRGGAAEFAAEPIDYTTQILEMTLNYMGKKLQLSGGYIGNLYKNRNDHVTSIGTSTYELSLPFSNEAHQLFLNGGYNFDATTRGTFKLSYTHATVDEAIPASIVALAYAGAPTRLDGEMNTTLVFMGLTARPMKNLNLVANLRYHKVDEQTPASLIVCSGACDGTTTEVHGTPLDYETISGKLEGIYRLQDGYSVIAGIDIKQQDRTVPYGNDNDADGLDSERYVPFRSDLNEMTYRVQLRKSMSETINGALAFLHSKRDGSTYSAAVHSYNVPTDPEPPYAIDPINISDRERNKVRATLDWMPSERANLTFNVEVSQDNYNGHKFGLRDGSALLMSVDGSYQLTKDWQMTGWISHDRTRAKQHNWRDANNDAGSNFSEAWLYDTLTDTGDSIGLGLEGKLNSKLRMGGNLEWTRTNSEYDQDIVPNDVGVSGSTLFYPGTTGPLPDIKSTVLKLDIFAEYAVEKNADLRFDLIYQHWETNDWTWEFSNGSPFAYGTNDDTQIRADQNQEATFIGVRYIYKFK